MPVISKIEPNSLCLTYVLAWIFIAVINVTKSKLGRKWFYLPYRSHTTTEGSEGKNSRPKQKPWRRCCSLACSVCFLIQLMTTCPGMAVLGMGEAHPRQSLIKELHCRLAGRPILWAHFPGWDPLFPNDTSFVGLYQVDKTNHHPFCILLTE